MLSKLSKYIKRIPTLLIFVSMLYFMQINNLGSEKKLITFDEAYTLAVNIATEWKAEALLYNAGSVDINSKENCNYDKRAGWNFDFSFTNSNEHYIIEIKNGQVYCENTVKGNYVTEYDLIKREEMSVSFDELIQKSINDIY